MTRAPSSAMSHKRSLTSDDSLAVSPSTEAPTKRRPAHSSSGRTGQACDRCKVRKIRCDATEGGCIPCRQSNVECKTSDRITGRAVARGHTENLENANSHLRRRIADLEALLKRNGIDSGSLQTDSSFYSPSSSSPPPPAPHNQARPHDAASANKAKSEPSGNSSPESISPKPALLSQPTGFSLDVFGMKIDFSSFAAEVDPVFESGTSFEVFHDTLFNLNVERYDFGEPVLPDRRETCVELIKLYIYGLNPWLPVVHPPDLLAIVDRLYDASEPQPDVPDLCMVHMALALINYHTGIRNKLENVLRQSFAHYHFVLKHFAVLLRHRTLKDFQAMAMLCGFVRGFPKPTVCWYTTHSTMLAAVEVGLHRSISVFPEEAAKLTPTEIHLRKCIFWTCLQIYVSHAGKFGRPMLLQRCDFDIEMPDSTGTEASLPGPDWDAQPLSFSFEAMSYFYKLSELWLDTYNKLYAVRPDGKYDDELRDLDARHDKWKRQLPAYLSRGSIESKEPKNQPYATWIASWSAELDLALHHPAVCRTRQPEIIEKNLTTCISATSVIIQTTAELLATKSNEATWTQVLVYTAALFTSLFAYWERRDQVSPNDLQRLRQDVDTGLRILASVGGTLGTSDELRERVQKITDRCLVHLENHVYRKAGLQIRTKASPSMSSRTQGSPPSVQQAYDGLEKVARTPPQQQPQQQPQPMYSNYDQYANDASQASQDPNSFRANMLHEFNPAISQGPAMPSLALGMAYPRQLPTSQPGGVLTNHWTQFAAMSGHSFQPMEYGSNEMLFNSSLQHLGIPNLLPPSGQLDVPVVSQPWPMTVGYQQDGQVG